MPENNWLARLPTPLAAVAVAVGVVLYVLLVPPLAGLYLLYGAWKALTGAWRLARRK